MLIVGLLLLPAIPLLIAYCACRRLDTWFLHREVNWAIDAGIPVTQLAEQDWIDGAWLAAHAKTVWDRGHAPANLVVPAIEANAVGRLRVTDEELDEFFERHRKGTAE